MGVDNSVELAASCSPRPTPPLCKDAMLLPWQQVLIIDPIRLAKQEHALERSTQHPKPSYNAQEARQAAHAGETLCSSVSTHTLQAHDAHLSQVFHAQLQPQHPAQRAQREEERLGGGEPLVLRRRHARLQRSLHELRRIAYLSERRRRLLLGPLRGRRPSRCRCWCLGTRHG